MRKKIEFKKIAFAGVTVYALIYITTGRIAELCNLTINTSVDTALVYVVLGAFIAYCGASTADHINIAKNGYKKELGGDGTE